MLDGAAESFETFDSGDGESGEFETFDNLPEATKEIDAKEEKKEAKKEKVSEDLKVLKDSEADSEGKLIKEDGKKAEKKKEESFDDEEEESEEESEEAVEEAVEEKSEDDKPKSKLRLRMGGELYNVDANATLPVKIDGKVEEVNVQDLINNYSGKTAWDKKFTEIGKEKKQVEFEKRQLESQNARLKENVQKVIAPLRDPNKNPLDALMNLVEMSGDDPYTAYRRIMEANLEEISSLMDMSEVERELHFHKKKDELYGKIARQRQAKTQEEERFNQLSQRVDTLRQAYNVSEDDFVDASEELEAAYSGAGLDPNTITEETVVDFASLRPHIATVKELVKPYVDNISEERYGDVVAQLSRYLRDGRADIQSVTQILARNFSVEEDVKELNTKVYQKAKGKPASRKVETEVPKWETFDDDWD